jgi:hypothetical protein
VIVTHRLCRSARMTHARDAMALSMKLWVEPESRRAMSQVPLTLTMSAIVRLNAGERVQGDGRLFGHWGEAVDFLVHNLDGE